ncbi:MAG: hypothetical protein JW723_00685 [Bacteroidales bacterium]|nr:hypothetical protein [Bacteroidales bacterium]
MINYILLIFIVLFICHDLNGQEPFELVGDRPDQTESSLAVPHQSLQIESGFLYMKSTGNDAEYIHTEYNSTLLRFGLMKFMELRFGAGFEATIPGTGIIYRFTLFDPGSGDLQSENL